MNKDFGNIVPNLPFNDTVFRIITECNNSKIEDLAVCIKICPLAKNCYEYWSGEKYTFN